MEAGPEYDPRTIEEIFQDFKSRRAGLIKAFTTDVEEFFRQCDPAKENLCLIGFPDETWSVDLPAAKVPNELPEPVLGINFNRDRMSKKEWLTLVAAHSDSWLHSVAFYYASLVARSSAGRSDRARLFSMINDLPSVSETVLGSFEKPSKEKSSATTHKGILKGFVQFRIHKGHRIMEAGSEDDPSIVEKIFQDFKGRRAALIQALTTDSQKFFWQCDPAKENLCLFGFPDETWSVNLPAEEIPPEIPEPLLGINFARDGMRKKDWLKLVAVYSDSWLLSVAFYIATRFAVGKSDRVRLFSMINDLPTVYEALLESFEKPSKKVEDGEGVEEQDDNVIMCLICYRDYSYRDERWIVCDVCHNWFHFGCVDITQEIAAQMMKYKCPFCSTQQLQI